MTHQAHFTPFPIKASIISIYIFLAYLAAFPIWGLAKVLLKENARVLIAVIFSPVVWFT